MATAERSDAPSPEHFKTIDGPVWRVVEGQHRISSDRLAGNPADQDVLEGLIEEVKPPMPEAARHLPKLLGTPFRYGYSVASRFRRANERPGILYTSETEAAAVAEKAYWSLKFFSRSPDAATPNTIVPHTSFTVRTRSERSLDLTAAPYDERRSAWTHPHDYTACQDFARGAREVETQAIRYESVRDPSHDSNVAILDPATVDGGSLEFRRTWHFRFEARKVTAYAAFPSAEHVTFTSEQFGLTGS